MGIVVNQSIKNTVITYIGFGIGAINLLFLYTKFLADNYVGLVMFILSTANILMPIMVLGTHNTIIKFYSSFKTRQQQSSFLSLMLLLPIIIIVFICLITFFGYNFISNWLASKNKIIADYTWLILVSSVSFAYFELFYAWCKVQLKSVFGNLMKEVFHRLGIMALLFVFYFGYLNVNQLINSIVGVFVARMLIMMCYAFFIRKPVFSLYKIPHLSNILKYTLLIIIAGSVANIILEIDKFMIGKLAIIENVAYYSVAIFTASVIAVPARSMHQITNPLTAKLLNENKKAELKILYRKTSLTLFLIGGFIFLLIVLNISELYKLIAPNYVKGILVVLSIGAVKLFDNLLGNNNSIIFNSDYYRIVLVLGVLLVIFTVLLNLFLIPIYGINGAAYATLITISLHNVIKLLFVYYKFSIHPFSVGTLKTLFLIIIGFLAFYFWNFNFHPMLNIACKSIIFSLGYGVVMYSFNLSDDISTLINSIFKKLKL